MDWADDQFVYFVDGVGMNVCVVGAIRSKVAGGDVEAVE